LLSSKAVILQLWKEQHERIVGITFDNTMDCVKLSKPRAEKKNFKERDASAPLGAVKHIKDLENDFFPYGFNRMGTDISYYIHVTAY
jgi:hypothetical protein